MDAKVRFSAQKRVQYSSLKLTANCISSIGDGGSSPLYQNSYSDLWKSENNPKVTRLQLFGVKHLKRWPETNIFTKNWCKTFYVFKIFKLHACHFSENPCSFSHSALYSFDASLWVYVWQYMLTNNFHIAWHFAERPDDILRKRSAFSGKFDYSRRVGD